MSDLPDCGLYRTSQPLGEDVPAGRLVYFHNHGDPGAGLYTPRAWIQNRAQWHDRGFTLKSPEYARSLIPLPREGFYKVARAFFCCERRCRSFDAGLLVQLGYDGHANAILFLPELTADGLRIPETGHVLAQDNTSALEPLVVARAGAIEGPKGLMH